MVSHHSGRNDRDRILFPISWFHAAIGLGIISLPFLALTVFARYPKHLAGPWRWIYVIGAVICLYFNLFVAVVQAFEKIPALHAMAPTQTEPPFMRQEKLYCARRCSFWVA
jgi:MFS family permease